MEPLIRVSGLSTHFHLSQGVLKAVDAVDLKVCHGETLALVGESGCGKSVTALSIMRLITPPGMIASGEIHFEGKDLLKLSAAEMQKIRGNRISMIFQDPMSSLNPVLSIGAQIAEGLMLHRGMTKNEAAAEGISLLGLTGIPSPEERFRDYPHQMSGGMRQRVMIAMALACRPALLIADEPTTALDVTIQAQILELIDRLKAESNMGLILITHDLGIVAERAHRTAIMYAGKIVELAPTAALFSEPLHPYAIGLLDSLPQHSKPGQRLKTIPGSVPGFFTELPGCGFCDRCPVKFKDCLTGVPEMKEVAPDHFVRCHKFS